MNNFLFSYFFNFSKYAFIGDSAVFVDQLTYVFLVIILISIIWFGERKFYSVALLFLSSFTAWLLVAICKVVFHVTRPFIALGITPLIRPTDFSFPSGHSAVFAALAVSMYFINRRAGMVLGVLALVIGISRVILGVHYPIDVLGGFLLGTVVAALYVRLFKHL